MAGSDGDQRRRQQALDLGHGAGEPGALAVGERREDRPGQLVGPAVQQVPLGTAGVGQADGPHPTVPLGWPHPDEPAPSNVRSSRLR